MEDIGLSIENAFHQATMTAEHYFNECLEILRDEDMTVCGLDRMTLAVELAKVCAKDFHTAVISSRLQEIRDEIKKLSNTVDNLD